MEEMKKSIVRTVAYFDIFHYPMTMQEIKLYMDMPCTEQSLYISLNALVRQKVLFKTKDFYQLKHDDSVITERINANALAEKQIVRARKIASFLSKFPFIEGIAISGSLSKKVATKKSDYDFFIITEKNNLWLCRFVFSMFIRLASLFGFKKYFCLNYIIDTSYLQVQEQNIFTATEIATLMPVYGDDLFVDFFAANNWVYQYFPNLPFIEHPVSINRKGFVKKLIEICLRNKAGQKVDNALMYYFDKRWRKMKAQNHITESGFILGSRMVNKRY